MEIEEGVKIIRENARKLLNHNRRLQRDDESNFRRRIQSSRASPEDITNIVEKLKTKSSITVSELRILKNALMVEDNVIETVLNTHGALRGIVRELIGQDVPKQLEASDCLCNLALGEVRACATVVKAAGPYLVARLDNTTSKLSVNCAYVLGTLAGSGSKVSELLTTQGALSTLSRLLISNDEELQTAALYAVTHFVVQLKDDLSSEHLKEIILAISKLELHKEMQKLLFSISCYEEFMQLLPAEQIEHLEGMILQDLAVSVQDHLSKCSNDVVCCKLVYSFRILANLVRKDNYIPVMRWYENNFDIMSKLLKANNENVNESVLWLLGNLYDINKCSAILDLLIQQIKQ